MAVAVPEASSICIELKVGPGEICIELPGGVTLCASADVEYGDPAAIFRGLLGELNAAMTPLTPFFNILDVVKKIFECIEAIKDAITQLNPEPIISCLPNLAAAVDKLLKLLPIYSVPSMIRSILTAIILGLEGLKDEISALILSAARVLAAELRGAELGNAELIFIADCAQTEFDIEFQNFNESIKPLSRLIGLMNTFLELAGLPCIKIPLGPAAEISDAILDVIQAAIDALIIVRNAIPAVPLNLLPIPSPGDPC